MVTHENAAKVLKALHRSEWPGRRLERYASRHAKTHLV